MIVSLAPSLTSFLYHRCIPQWSTTLKKSRKAKEKTQLIMILFLSSITFSSVVDTNKSRFRQPIYVSLSSKRFHHSTLTPHLPFAWWCTKHEWRTNLTFGAKNSSQAIVKRVIPPKKENLPIFTSDLHGSNHPLPSPYKLPELTSPESWYSSLACLPPPHLAIRTSTYSSSSRNNLPPAHRLPLPQSWPAPSPTASAFPPPLHLHTAPSYASPNQLSPPNSAPLA
jgi:hypothetical protein